MIILRKSEDRGRAQHGWLDSHHTFSFADYFDPSQMGYGDLRVINEDRVSPSSGFGMHSHSNMEIISYVIEGALAHRDTMGNASTLSEGDVQRMSAGMGVMHSECNPSDADPVHFLQIWILPSEKGLVPGYEQKHFPEADKTGKLCLIASPDGRNSSLSIRQEAEIYATIPLEGVTRLMRRGRIAYLQVVKGNVNLNGLDLSAGDGAKIESEHKLRLKGDGEALIFDLKG